MLSLEKNSTIVEAIVEEWRLIVDAGLPGPLNMGVDEALLESVVAGGPPVLRFYTWELATLSLGTNQATGEISRGECEGRGFDLVRRLTGGRAVLHQYELTYAVISAENNPRVSGGVVESYRKISTALVEGLGRLGAQVSLAAPDRQLLRSVAPGSRRGVLNEDNKAVERNDTGAVCFDAATAYELTAGGKKLVGSAQARRGGALLQHGSILLDIDFDAWAAVFAYASDAGRERARRKLPQRMTSLREELSRPIEPGEVVAAMLPAFEQALCISLHPGTLSAGEGATAQRLEAEKYGSEAWTARK